MVVLLIEQYELFKLPICKMVLILLFILLVFYGYVCHEIKHYWKENKEIIGTGNVIGYFFGIISLYK